MSLSDSIENNFNYHQPATEEVGAKHAAIRQLFKDLAYSVDTICPDGREKALAITKLEEGMMWANAAIARNPEWSSGL